MSYKDKDKKRACDKKYRESRSSEEKEEAKEYQRAYQKEYKKTHKPSLKDKEYQKAYQKEYRKEYRKSNPEKYRTTSQNWRGKNQAKLKEYVKEKTKKCRDFIISVKLLNGCQNPNCKWVGEFEPCSLDFHHIDNKDKIFNLGGVSCRSKSSILKEMSKCCVLCANCHRQVRWGTLDVSNFAYCKVELT